MAEIVQFHHAQGLTAGLVEFADELRKAGHTVHTPDLFEGRTFGSIGDGMEYVNSVGFGEMINRADQSVEALADDLVYIGLSLGVVPAQKLAQTRPGARGAVFLYSCVPASEFGAWPPALPVQIHGMDADPYFVDEGDIEAARDIVEIADNGELFVYSGDQHYFTDSSLPSYDAAASELVLQRIITFLESV